MAGGWCGVGGRRLENLTLICGISFLSPEGLLITRRSLRKIRTWHYIGDHEVLAKPVYAWWDCSFQDGSLVEEVDGHTTIFYHRLQLDWFPTFVWPRDLCYMRYWRRNSDGSYVILFCLREHENCGHQPGYVRAHIERLQEYFAQTDERTARPRTPVKVNMASCSVPMKGKQENQSASVHNIGPSPDNAAYLMDEYSDADEDFQNHDEEAHNGEHEAKRTEEPVDQIDLSCFSGNDKENGRNCWRISDGNHFKVRSKRFCYDKSKMPGGKHLMDLVAVDWFKGTHRMDHVARHAGCAAKVPGSTNYSMVFYYVTKELVPGSLLQRFVDDNDEFRNSRLKIISSVPKGSWIVRQSVGSSPCLLGKAIECNYLRGASYLEVDIDVGSSTVAKGVVGLVIGVITSLVIDIAFLVQANTIDELPEQLIGAARISRLELSTAIVPKFEPEPDADQKPESEPSKSQQ